MRRTILAALSLLLVGAWSQPAQAQVPDELADLIPSWGEAFNAGDAAGVASHYTEDARRIPPVGDIQQGAAVQQAGERIGGGLLLGEVESRTRIIARLAEQFVDHRDPEAIEHTVEELAKQRIFGLALGYEDLNDHDALRYDALLALLAEKHQLTVEEAQAMEDANIPLGRSALPGEVADAARYYGITALAAAASPRAASAARHGPFLGLDQHIYSSVFFLPGRIDCRRCLRRRIKLQPV